MSRKAKGPGYTPRSGKSPVFKMMGSSPMRVEPTEPTEDITWNPEEVTGITTTETPTSTDTRTDYLTKGTSRGYIPTKTPDAAYKDWLAKNPGGSRGTYEKEASDWKESKEQKHEKTRSETKSTPKKETTQEKMAKGKHHSKYWDPKTKSYRVKQYDFKQLSSGKYTSSGRGKQTSDLSLDEWREQYGSLEEQKKTGEVGKRTII